MGRIKEFPGLQIDDFKTYEKAPLLCLLSHAHSDHLSGLDRQSYYGPLVYCTATTRALVLNIRGSNNAKNQLKYNHLRKEHCGIEILQTLELNRGKQLKCGSQDLMVTAVDAHHCPGSCMFLIQSESVSVLYTGDIRCEQWYINMLALHPALLPFTVGKTPISIYMDNIYEQHHEHSLEYHSSTHGIEQLMALLERGYPAETPLCALFTTIGYENVLIALAERFRTQIHMDPYYYNLYASAADTCPLSRAVVERSTTQATSSCRVHWCKKGECTVRDQKNAVYFSPCITISEQAVNERNRPLQITQFDVTGHCELPVYGDATTGARYILGVDQHTLLPGHLLFYFSRHASRPCLGQLIDTFTTKTVRSLDGNSMQGFSSFQSSQEELTTDESQHLPLATLPLIRKQPVRMKERPVKRAKFSSSSSHDEALMFLQGGKVPRADSGKVVPRVVPGLDTNEGTKGKEEKNGNVHMGENDQGNKEPQKDSPVAPKLEQETQAETTPEAETIPENTDPPNDGLPGKEQDRSRISSEDTSHRRPPVPAVAPPSGSIATPPPPPQETPETQATMETQESLVLPIWSQEPNPPHGADEPPSSAMPPTQVPSSVATTQGDPPPPVRQETPGSNTPADILNDWFSMQFDFNR